jgi:hypothetical protein
MSGTKYSTEEKNALFKDFIGSKPPPEAGARERGDGTYIYIFQGRGHDRRFF